MKKKKYDRTEKTEELRIIESSKLIDMTKKRYKRLEKKHRKTNNTQLSKDSPVKRKDARRTVKHESEKSLVTSKRDCGMVDHNFEHPVETLRSSQILNKTL